jgi:hypothetical protein
LRRWGSIVEPGSLKLPDGAEEFSNLREQLQDSEGQRIVIRERPAS